MSRFSFYGLLGAGLLCAGTSHAEFVGTLRLGPPGCRQVAQCTVLENFGWTRDGRIGWQADAGDVTDGASIPKWAQKFAGVPFEPTYLPAAVLHDHYSRSVRPVRGWLETQRMFYDVLLASGVSEPRASVLYAGVLIGSRKWITRMRGKPCDVGATCTNQTVTLSLDTQPSAFDSAAHATRFAALRAQIEADGITGPDAVEGLARAVLPDDIYLANPSGVIREGISFGVFSDR